MEFTGNIIPLRAPAGAGPTFAQLAEEYMRAESPRFARPQDFQRHIEHLRPLWALTEAQLRPSVVKGVLYGLLAPAGPMGAATVNGIRGTGKRIVHEAIANDLWQGRNPFDFVRRLPQERPQTRSLTLAEARAMLPHLAPHKRREALAMLYLGLRPGELKALEQSDLDIPGRVVTVRRSNGRSRTKTGKVRSIPLPEALVPHVEIALLSVPPDCRLVFPGLEGRRQRADAKFSLALKTALAKADLVTGYEYVCRRRGCGHREERRERMDLDCPLCRYRMMRCGVAIPVRYYDLRHTSATLHREAGADPLAIQLVLGHAPETLTDSVYTHLSMDYLRREMNKLKI